MFHYCPDLRGFTSAKVPQKPSLKWTFKTEGAINSSPAVSDGVVFIGSDDFSIYAINLTWLKNMVV